MNGWSDDDENQDNNDIAKNANGTGASGRSVTAQVGDFELTVTRIYGVLRVQVGTQKTNKLA